MIFVSSPKFTQEKYRWLDISPYSNLCVLIQRVDLTYKKISSGWKEKLNSLRSRTSTEWHVHSRNQERNYFFKNYILKKCVFGAWRLRRVWGLKESKVSFQSWITRKTELWNLDESEMLAEKLEKATAPHSSALAWRIPGIGEPGGLQSMGLRRVRPDWATSLSLFTFMHWRRKWQPSPVFLPGESQGRGSLVGCRLWGHIELDTTEAT